MVKKVDPLRTIQKFKRLSGRGDSRGWRFDREEIHQRSAPVQGAHPARVRGGNRKSGST